MKKHLQSGFSITELLIYIAIVGILAAAILPTMMGYLADAKVAATKRNLSTVKTAIDAYYLANNKYPARLEYLVERPKGDEGKNWHEYLDKLPLDGWKQEFNYKITPGSKHPYELYSDRGGEAEEDPEKRIDIWKLDKEN